MITGIILAISRGTAILGAVFLVVALLKQLLVAVGLLFVIIKLAIVVIFLAVMILIVVVIYRDRKKMKADL